MPVRRPAPRAPRPPSPASSLMRFPAAVVREPAIEAWMAEQPDDLRVLALRWFDVMRSQGPDVRETMHDDQPTACVADAAFGYVDAFTNHVNVGFFRGASLPDPAGLLEGSGRYMRHVKLRPGRVPDAQALTALIGAACADMRERVAAEGGAPTVQG